MGRVIVAGAAGESGPVAALGVAGLALGGPIVHWSHGHGLKGLGSLGLNVGAPIAGGFLGFAVECAVDCDGFLAGTGGAALGILAGHVVAASVDIAVLGRHPNHPDRGRLSLAPTFDAGPGRLALGAAGRF